MYDYLKDLNENQMKAVLTTNKKVLVMAGAGSGKTKVLTTRINYLIDEAVPEREICAFTFTNKAAKEMKWRLQTMLKRETAATISTFHSFCYSFLMEGMFYAKLGFSNKPSIIFDEDKSKIIGEILKKYNKDYSNIPFVSAISKIKNKAKITNLDREDMFILNSVYYEYQEHLRNSNSIDFDDMIPLVIELARIDDEFKRIIQCEYLLVDECQDTNQIQYELIKLMSEEYGNVFMVGDEDQLIYTFRNSDISIIKDFESNADEVIILNQNYRCNKTILELANSLIQYNPNRISKVLTSDIEPVVKVEFKEWASQMDEAEGVAKKIHELVKKHGIEYKDIAILYRNNNQSFVIEKELNKRKIPYDVFGGKPFFDYKDIKSVINTYRLIMDPRNEIAFANIYNQPAPLIEGVEYSKFIEHYRQNRRLNLIDFACNYGLNTEFQNLGMQLMKLRDLFKVMNNEDFYMELLQVLKYNKYLKESNQQKSQYTRLMAFKEMIRDLPKDEFQDSFNAMLLDNKDFKANNSVSLLTMHRAKGLEFQVVFIVGFNDGIIPGYVRRPSDLEEERRLGYVAITRAKQYLFLYCSIVHYINGNITKMRPSIFIQEAGIEQSPAAKFFSGYAYNK